MPSEEIFGEFFSSSYTLALLLLLAIPYYQGFAECKVEKETIIMTQKTTKSGRHKRENENESKFFSN